MPGIYKPAAVRFLAEIVDKHCAARGIKRGQDRDRVAHAALSLYALGADDEQKLLAALARHDDPAADHPSQ